jgi:hypothetical protein
MYSATNSILGLEAKQAVNFIAFYNRDSCHMSLDGSHYWAG